MVKYILDTDTLIYFLKGNPDIVERVATTMTGDLATTIINQTELLFGAFNSSHKKQNLQKIESFFEKIPVLTFCKDSAYIFAEQKTALKKQGNIVADLDLMIASVAICHQKVLITNNTKHFARISKLKIDNWLNSSSHSV